MRFLHVVNVRWFNATAWYAHMLCLGLEKLGHDAAVLGLPDSPPVKKSDNAGLVTYEARLNSSSPLIVPDSIRRINKYIKEYRPDVIVCHRGEMFWYFTHLRYRTKPTWKLVRVRGDRRTPGINPLNRWLYNNAVDHIVTSGEFMKDVHTDGLRVPENKVSVLFGGVDTDYFRRDGSGGERVRGEFGLKESDFVIGILGRFDPVKGHESLIKACSELIKGGRHDIKLMIAGFDAVTTEEDIRRILIEHNMTEHAFFTGRRDDVPALISAMDLGAIPSLGSEAICRVGMEMMACGVPVIGSRTGVIPEIFPEQNIFEPGDVDSIVGCIKDFSAVTEHYNYITFSERFADIFMR
ncbi:glycosyltransferase [Limisalsivibrio acetivorans]|uniref:glycosyltransferase n=1 Tax=Limisalsivibrio acetivorans TaxID=1304888 RepID=UPI0003B55C7D|nr:glycosyltransferase [Limisalsivibrio acetivorans]